MDFGQVLYNSRPTSGTRLQNGLEVLDFDGGEWMKSASHFATGSNFSVFAVAKFDSINHLNDSLFSIRNNHPSFQIDAGYSNGFYPTVCPNFDGLQQDFLQSIRSRSQHLCFRLRSQPIFLEVFLDGSSMGTTTYESSPGQVDNHLVLFANRGENNFPDGFLAEFLYYPTALTPSSG